MAEQDQPRPPGQIHYASAAFVGTTGFNAEAFNQVEEALRKLRPQVQAALLDDAEAALKVVRDDPTSLEKQHGLKMALHKISDWIASSRLVDVAMREGMREAVHELLKALFGG
jgi:hypothetical protein